MYSSRIFFKKTNLPSLHKQGYNIVDMHCHSKYSDGWNTVPTLIKHAKKLKIGLALTDHNTIKGSMKLKKEDIFAIPGMEITLKDNIHALTYFYNFDHLKEFYEKFVEPNKTKDPMSAIQIESDELFDNLKNYDAIVSSAHPFSSRTRYGLLQQIERKTVTPKLKKHFSALEVINGMDTFSANKNSFDYLVKSKKHYSFTSGSDAHSAKSLGVAVTFSQTSTINEFLDAIKKKENFVIGSKAGPVKKGKATLSILSRHHLIYPRAFIKAKLKSRKDAREFKKRNSK